MDMEFPEGKAAGHCGQVEIHFDAHPFQLATAIDSVRRRHDQAPSVQL
jgi:hypothetical protein